ncbi:putative DNA binding domain-containing protein [Bifidobacterium pullorum subsp. saeculare]|uniref:DNA binding domain-containing protein n=1 Tax=Bifidobacterium pullorum subsp. saeculare TaxID=78257 RepID=A0A938WZM7_9BIFI|nr:ATP-binding protein [Bifidobacterium pullorum]MBM6699968.1 putative DNA binding domain-containing protein [Bifidobacterium pullorum subsp. saeculare]
MDNGDYTARMTRLIRLMRIIGNDTQQCEVKECRRHISTTMAETLSAFSNGNGGYVILGLSEKAGFTPVEGFDARAMQESLSQVCEKLTPPVRPVIVTCPFEGANLVFAVIDEMLPREKPCYITAVGPHGGSYIRTGDGDRKMTEYEVARLLEEQRQPEHDIAIVEEATTDDLDPAALRALLECERTQHPHVFAHRDDTDMLLDLRVIRPADDGCQRPTLAGLMALGHYPQKFFPRLNVTIAVYPGTSRDEVLAGEARLVASRTITGPIPTMIADAVDALAELTARDPDPTAEDGSGAEDGHPAYPRLVLREVIANALVHRDYSQDALGTPVIVEVFTDRIEVTNPGGLYGAVSKKRLTREALTSARNAFLVALLQSTPCPGCGTVLGNDGTGYMRIGAALRRELREPVHIDNSLDRFRIVIPGRNFTAHADATADDLSGRRGPAPARGCGPGTGRRG